MNCDTAGCVRPRCCAAALMLPVRATATKTSSARADRPCPMRVRLLSGSPGLLADPSRTSVMQRPKRATRDAPTKRLAHYGG